MIYSNFFRSKIDNFQRKIFDIFLFSFFLFFFFFFFFAQNIDCGYTLEPPRLGGSNEYPQSMFWSKNKNKRYTLAYSSFTIKVGFKGVFIARTYFPDGLNRWIRPRSRSFLGKGQLAPVFCRRQCRFASIAVKYQGRDACIFPTRVLL